jgi:hypothetical protein
MLANKGLVDIIIVTGEAKVPGVETQSCFAIGKLSLKIPKGGKKK